MNEFVAGMVGGSVSLVVGHPFDTIKVYLYFRSNIAGLI